MQKKLFDKEKLKKGTIVNTTLGIFVCTSSIGDCTIEMKRSFIVLPREFIFIGYSLVLTM